MAPSPPPWELDECFPPKPPGHDYGYLRNHKFVGCTREELIIRCSKVRFFGTDLVWHPDAPRLVPASTLDFLYEPLRRRFRKRLIKQAVVRAVIFIILCLFAYRSRRNLNLAGLLLLMAAIMGGRPLYHAVRMLRRFELVGLPIADADHFWVWIRSRKIPMTALIFLTISVVALCQRIFGFDRSVVAAGLIKDAVRQGQWWRIFTAAYLHGGWMHYLLNMAGLGLLGRLTESLSSFAHLAIVFLAAAAVGNICSFSLVEADSLGSSGGILGLLGFLLVLGFRRKSVLPNGFVNLFAINIAIVAATGLVAISIVDNAAHLGGILTGAALGLLLIPHGTQLPLAPSRPLKWAGALAAGAVVAIGLFCAWKIFAG